MRIKHAKYKSFLLGLGNNGEEYLGSRHNVGRDFVVHYAKAGVHAVVLESYMNTTGKIFMKYLESIKAKVEIPRPKKGKAVEPNLIAIYDDLDLPLGKIKISFNKSSGGHKGIESLIKALKSKEFIRIRIGISPATSTGKIKKPVGDGAVQDFLLSKFTKKEQVAIEVTYGKIGAIIENIVAKGLENTLSVQGMLV